MHPAPSLAEAPPKTDEPRQTQGQQRPTSPVSAINSGSIPNANANPQTQAANSLGNSSSNGSSSSRNSHGSANPNPSANSTSSPNANSHHSHTPSASPPMRKDTTSSISTTATNASSATIISNETTGTSYSLESSPQYLNNPVFSIKEGSDMTGSRRASRRRTGPLSAEQREKAALIRKLGACNDCRRRRVACHPNHHNMTWEDAMRKYRSHSPTSLNDLLQLGARPLSPRPLSPAPLHNGNPPIFTHDPQEMEIDSPPTPSQPPGRPSLSEARIRTPLPSGPRLEKIAAQASQAAQAAQTVQAVQAVQAVQVAQAAQGVQVLPGIESLKSELQITASRIASNPYRSRYSAAQVLLIYWQDDEDKDVETAVNELAEVFEKHYSYVYEIQPIPSSSENRKSSWRWLSRSVTNFVDNRDQRDVLKIVFYIGHSYLDGDREMVLASSRDRPQAPTIRWSGIQQILEEACSDTLILMDAAYYPSSKLVRQQGVLEVVAASASEDHILHLDRTSFTRAIIDQLRTRATQKFLSPLTAAEMHSRLLSNYPKMIQDRNPEREMVTSFPSPLHMQISANNRLPSVVLAPIRRGLPLPVEPDLSGPQMSLTIRLSDDALNMDSWSEWLRMMPDGVKDVKVEGPYRSSFR